MKKKLSKNQQYWVDRISKIKDSQYNKVDKAEKELKKLYSDVNKHIRNEMFIFYGKYSDSQGMTVEEARKLLNEDELKNWKISLEEYKELAQNKVNKEYLDEMYIRSRVNRLEALESQIQAEVRLLGEKQATTTKETLKSVYQDTYQRTTYDIAEGIGMVARFDKFDSKELEHIVKKPFQGSNFSGRIWEDKAGLIEDLNKTLVQHIVLGKAPSQLADSFAKRLGTSYYKAARLLNTEAANITEQATLQSYKDTNISEYEILAVLDLRTSEICREMDGKRFLTKDAMVGINYPPFHPNCRTTTVPIIELDEFQNETEIPKKINNIARKNNSRNLTKKEEEYLNRFLKNKDINTQDHNLKSPFSYRSNDGKIHINPNHKDFKQYDFIKSIIHETFHKIDDENGTSILFAKEINDCINNSMPLLDNITLSKELENNMSICDIIKAITGNDVGNYGHSSQYFNGIGNTEKEILANLVTEYITDDRAGMQFINNCTPLRDLLEIIKKEYRL